MHHLSLLSKCALSFVLVMTLAVGMQAFVPAVFADCGTNAGGGNCKQTSQNPPASDGWLVVRMLISGLRIYGF
jgi:hypothetical protein